MQDTIYQPGEKSIFPDLLDTEKFLEKYEHSLRGEILVSERQTDKSTGKEIMVDVWQQKYKPKMTDEGIMSSISMLRAICDKAISLTDLSEEQCNILIRQNLDTWLDFLCVNGEEFGLHDPSKISEVYNHAKNFIIAKINSAVNGRIIDAISTTTTVTENRNVESEPKAEDKVGGNGLLRKFGIQI